MTSHRPGLIVHFFLPSALESPADARSLWDTASRLGMDKPIETKWPVDLTDTALSSALHSQPSRDVVVVAARQRLCPGGFEQAIVCQVHQVTVVSFLLAPNDDSVDWQSLYERWSRGIATPVQESLGSAVIFTILVPGRRRWFGASADPVAGRPEELAGQLATRLPATIMARQTVAAWAPAWWRTSRGLLSWELSEDGIDGNRVLIAVTGAHNEAAMDDWTWGRTGPGLPPLTRYLMHSAVIRYQYRVLVNDMPAIRTTIRRAEQRCDQLDRLLRTPAPQLSQLLAADRALGLAQIDESGIVAALGDVQDMARTVEIAESNRHLSLEGISTNSEPGSSMATDSRIAAWLVEQLRTEEIYLRSAGRQVREVARLAGVSIEQQQRQRQERLTLMQTSVLGALLMALAVIQSLTFRVPLPGPVLAPLICVLATIALLLPSAVLYWRGDPAASPRPRKLAAAGSAVFGSALGWLGASCGWSLVAGRGAPALWSVIIAAVAGTVLVVVVMLAFRSRASVEVGSPV